LTSYYRTFPFSPTPAKFPLCFSQLFHCFIHWVFLFTETCNGHFPVRVFNPLYFSPSFSPAFSSLVCLARVVRPALLLSCFRTFPFSDHLVNVRLCPLCPRRSSTRHVLPFFSRVFSLIPCLFKAPHPPNSPPIHPPHVSPQSKFSLLFLIECRGR